MKPNMHYFVGETFILRQWLSPAWHSWGTQFLCVGQEDQKAPAGGSVLDHILSFHPDDFL